MQSKFVRPVTGFGDALKHPLARALLFGFILQAGDLVVIHGQAGT